MLVHDLDTVGNNVQNGKQHNYVGDQQLGDDYDVPLDVEEKQEMQRQSSTRYTFDEYVILTDGEEHECYHESMESEERQKACERKSQTKPVTQPLCPLKQNPYSHSFAMALFTSSVPKLQDPFCAMTCTSTWYIVLRLTCQGDKARAYHLSLDMLGGHGLDTPFCN
ncbi:hypothetical protein CR513_13745, partial [Mucuna pruriens]